MKNNANNDNHHGQHKHTNKAPRSKSQGVGRLTVDAVIAITDIIESMHRNADPLSTAKPKTARQQLSGISGLVYRNIRNMTHRIGKSIDRPLAVISKIRSSQPDSMSTQALLAVLNGVLGDYLVATDNPLAIEMQFRKDGHNLTDIQLQQLIKQSKGKLLILVHGLCMNDMQWRQQAHDHGVELAAELGLEVIYLHYNSGRHVSENGAQFSTLIEALLSLTDEDLELNILAHSMGGLVSRSALHVAQNRGYLWPELLNNLVFLGTPHHGAALEKAGNWIDLILGAHSYTAPLARLVKVRSAGITDLRYGNVQDADWQSRERFEFSGDQRLPLPLPASVNCYAIATSATESLNYPLGDGLVSIKSALGEHSDPAFDLHIPDKRKWRGTSVNHNQLLYDPKIYQIVKNFLGQND